MYSPANVRHNEEKNGNAKDRDNKSVNQRKVAPTRTRGRTHKICNSDLSHDVSNT